MGAFADRVIVVSGVETPMGQSFTAALAEQGAQVVAADRTDLSDSVDALLLIVPSPPPIPTTSLSDAEWDATVSTSMTNYFHLLKNVGAGMIARQRGVILIVGGLGGLTGFPRWAASSALEGALIALTRSLACEWAQYQVRIVYLACGAVDGEHISEANPTEFTITANALERTAQKRAASMAEIIDTAFYLLSDRASFTTGSVIRADGGWTAWGLLN